MFPKILCGNSVIAETTKTINVTHNSKIMGHFIDKRLIKALSLGFFLTKT